MSAESSANPSPAAQSSGVEQERAMLLDAEAQGGSAKLSVWLKLSGPGWLQSAITLGGGSLAGSLFLGMVAGYSMMWLQLMAMALGVIMLGAIGYVTLSTGKRPFSLINQHVNPVLGWSWALATLAANIVWCLPQFSLANAAVQQNLFPSLEGQTGWICGVLLAIAVGITSVYDRGGKGLKIYENSLRILVGMIVLCFVGVVVTLAVNGQLAFGAIFSGLIPDLNLISQPASAFTADIALTGEFQTYWTNLIVGMQRDIMITAVATAVGINMTFLFPYSLLKKRWDRAFRGLSLFDLSTGMAIPFVVATGCVVIASANSFHAQVPPGILGQLDADGKVVAADTDLIKQYENNLVKRVKAEHEKEFEKLLKDVKKSEQGKVLKEIAKPYFDSLTDGDKRLAAMLVKRDAKHLAASLAPLTGPVVANYVFGFGVLGMALSTITILMLISGFTFCEVFGFPQSGMYHRIGCLLPAIGVLGPFYWKDVAFWLAVPTSVFGMALLPIAYITFFLLMNNRAVLGDDMPKGVSRLIWNTLMGIACVVMTFCASWVVWSKCQWYGVGLVVALVGLALYVQITRSSTPAVATTEGEA